MSDDYYTESPPRLSGQYKLLWQDPETGATKTARGSKYRIYYRFSPNVIIFYGEKGEIVLSGVVFVIN